MQPENCNLGSANYKHIEFYFDTPVLLNLLGYQSNEEKASADELYAMLKNQKANIYYFPHASEEMDKILLAYKKSLNGDSHSYRTLEGLDVKNYNPSSVERLQNSWKRSLASLYGIVEKDIPPYLVRDDGSVDETKIVDENELKSSIRNQAKKIYKELPV